MSVSMWSYRPEVCDGGGCPGDCDLCDKPKNMEDEDDTTDYIKREDALRAFNGSCSTVDADDILRHLHKGIDVIKNIPSADVMPKTKEAAIDYLHYIGWMQEHDKEMTADVVEADKAQKEIDYWHDKSQSYEQTILKLSLNKADVVEVVRCNDCKHRYYDKERKLYYCEMYFGLGNVKNNNYCSYGEREEA